MKIPTRMPSGGILGICILGVAIRENPDTFPSRGRIWVFAFWGLRFVKIPTRMPSGGRILGICILGVAIRENPDTYAFWGLHLGCLHSGGSDS